VYINKTQYMIWEWLTRTVCSYKHTAYFFLSQYLTNFMHKICFTISFISCLYMFRARVLIIRRSKLHYTASGIITPIGGRLVHQTATYRLDVTRGCVMQFWPPDDEHKCSKHVEAWNKLITKQKNCAWSWLITEINILISFHKRDEKCLLRGTKWVFK